MRQNVLNELQKTVSLFGRLSKIIMPPPKLTISQWSERYRVISSEEASAPGPWRCDFVPYTVGMMDAISDPMVEKVVIMTGAQMGKTSVLLNTIGYHIHLDAAPVMVVMPTVTMGESFSTKRLSPMIRDSPVLKQIMPDEKSRSSQNTILEKAWQGGYIVIAGGNSTASLKSRPVRILLYDELDEIKNDLNDQGDPVRLAEVRTTGFPNRKIVHTSTPTVKGQSRIEISYNESTQGKWCHCCPDCSEYSQFIWRRLNFELVKVQCPYCEKYFSRREWEAAGEGKWIEDNPGHAVKGFSVNALDAGTLTWEQLITEWLEAERLTKRGDYSQLKTFLNVRACELWEERGEVVESHFLQSRREYYGDGVDLPDGVCVLTMGVDTQDNRICYEIVGWGLGFESWGIEYAEIFGDPRRGEVWNQLDIVLSRTFSYKNGKRLQVLRAGIDTGGHMTMQVYSYCKARQSRGVYALKGQGGERLPLTRPSKDYREKGLFIVGIDGVKADTLSWLKIEQPGDGYCHFPKQSDDIASNGYDANYFEMLTAEKRVFEQVKGGFGKYVWKKAPGARNEAFDCRNYARAALRIMSTQDEALLKRIHLAEPWHPSKAPKTPQPEILPVPRMAVRPKARVNRNRVAAEAAVTL